MPATPLEAVLTLTPAGLYCPAGDFHVDPWRGVARAIVTHAHGDHARHGSAQYLTSATGAELVRMRVGGERPIHALPFGQSVTLGHARVSLHPAGHILGSAQVRIETADAVVVVGGDHKLGTDPTSESFEPVPCDAFVCEATFALPIYRWPDPAEVFADLNAWWRANTAAQRTSVVFAYALGKAQRVLAGLDPTIGPIGCHGAVERFNRAYRAAGITLPPTLHASGETAKTLRGHGLIVAPPSTQASPWLRRFGPRSTAFASGWMQVRGTRRRRNVDRGFVLSDHADFPELLETIRLTGATHVGVTHGYTAPFARFLRERGMAADVIPTRFGDEELAAEDDRDAPAPDEPETARRVEK